MGTLSEDLKYLKEAFLAIAEERDTVIREYSGRHMQGASCVGIVIFPQDALKMPAHIVHWMHTKYQENVHYLREERTISQFEEFLDFVYEFCNETVYVDEMGHQAVMYWPNIKWEEFERVVA